MGRPWFKAKQYGWGWYPASWQGWTCMTAHIAVIVASIYLMHRYGEVSAYTVPFALLAAISSSLALVAVAWKKGETPHWNWGKKDRS